MGLSKYDMPEYMLKVADRIPLTPSGKMRDLMGERARGSRPGAGDGR